MRKFRRVMRKLPYLIVGLLMAAMGVLYVGALINNPNDLGPMTHYNGIIFGSYSAAHADMEGALAVGGTAILGSGGQFDVGIGTMNAYPQMGYYTNPNGYPSLLVNSVPVLGNGSKNTVHVRGGNGNGREVVMNENHETAYNRLSSIRQFPENTPVYAASDVIDNFFAKARRTSMRVSENIGRANSNSITFKQFQPDYYGYPTYYNSGLKDYENQFFTDSSGEIISDALVITVTSGSAITIMEPKIRHRDFEKYDLIVFDFPDAKSVTFTGGSLITADGQLNTSAPIGTDANRLLAKYCEKLLWNFPAAEKMYLQSHGVVGSVLAPNADVQAKGGSINGMLIADSFSTTGGAELHAFYMRKPPFDFDLDEVDNGNEEEEEELVEGSLELTKVDAVNTSIHLEGAVFQLEKKSGDAWTRYPDSSTTYATGPSGRLIIDGLPEGSYRITETKAPDGYTITDGGPHDFVIDKNNGTYGIPVKVTVENRQKSRDMIFSKIDSETKQPILGQSGERATFLLYEAYLSGTQKRYHQVGIYHPDAATGFFTLKKLSVGEYRLSEAIPPDGYDLDWDSQYRFIDIVVTDPGGSRDLDIKYTYYHSDGTAQTETYLGKDTGFKIPNTPLDENDPNTDQSYKLVVNKGDYTHEDADGNGYMPLKGAKFVLTYLGDSQTGSAVKTYTGTTDDLGQIYFSDLDKGWYKIEEVEAPPGYQKNGDSSEIIYIPDEENPLKRGFPVLPAIGSSWQNENTPVESLLPVRPSLGQSDYRGRGPDASPPIGYSDPIPPVSPVDGPTVRLPFSLLYDAMYFSNDPVSDAGLQIVKLDRNTEKPLAGAQFDVYQQLFGREMRFVTSVTSDESGVAVVTGLEPGTYYVEEVSPPPGYTIVQEPDDPGWWQMVVIEAGQTEKLSVLKFTNLPKRGEITVVKLDGDTNAPLQGAVFELWKYDVSKDGWELVNPSLTSGADGAIDINQDLEDGKYKLVEVRAPDGYEIKKDYLEDDGSILFDVTPTSVGANNGNTFTDGTIRLFNYPKDSPNNRERERGKSSGSNRIDRDPTPTAEMTMPTENPTSTATESSATTYNPGTGGSLALQGLGCFALIACGFWLGRKKEYY